MYKPTLIHDARVDIVAMHPLENTPERIKNDRELEKLIRRIVKLDQKEIKKEALILTEKDVNKIIGYMPFNDFNVKLDNLFAVYKYRAKASYAKYLFMSWLESFDRKDFNSLAVKNLLNDELFVEELKRVNLNKDIFLQWLTAESIPYFVGRFAYNSYKSEKGFEGSLEHFGVLRTSQLFLKCESLFYTYCLKQDYLKCGSSKLYEIVNRYDDYMFRVFLKNFVQLLDIGELCKYNELMPVIISHTSEYESSKQFNDFFQNENPAYVEKFIDWLHSYLTIRIFGNDERGRFWSKFKFVSAPRRMRSNDAIVMKMNQYIAIEFIGTGKKAHEALGPIYFYSNDYYKSDISKWVETATYNNNQLRQILYNDWLPGDTDYKLRVTHHGDWEGNVETNYLQKYGMTNRLYPYR